MEMSVLLRRVMCMCLKDVVAVCTHACVCWLSYARKERLNMSEIVLNCVFMIHIKMVFVCTYVCFCFFSHSYIAIELIPSLTFSLLAVMHVGIRVCIAEVIKWSLTGP